MCVRGEKRRKKRKSRRRNDIRINDGKKGIMT